MRARCSLNALAVARTLVNATLATAATCGNGIVEGLEECDDRATGDLWIADVGQNLFEDMKPVFVRGS
jgi:hypothetical protein